MFVIANQTAIRIRRERRLASATETEEDRCVASFADIRRAMHREYALQWQNIIEHAENTLLHFAGILRAADEHRLAREIRYDKHFAVELIFFGVCQEFAGVDDRPVWHVRLQLLRCRFPEQLFHEQTMPRKFRNDSNRRLIPWIRTGESIHYKQIAFLQMLHHILPELPEILARNRLVHFAPRNFVARAGFIHNPFIAR